jgi:plastocyanin
VPVSLQIEVGDLVIWRNEGAMTHTATRTADPAFDTGDIAAGTDSKAIAFDAVAAKLDYFCRPHRFMKATIAVAS